MSDGTINEHNLNLISADISKAVKKLEKQLIDQVKENPDFYGSAILDVSLRAGKVVSAKNSVEVVRKY